jgi:hypothetical protein
LYQYSQWSLRETYLRPSYVAKEWGSPNFHLRVRLVQLSV